MKSKYPFLGLVADGVCLSVRLQPRASKNELAGTHAGSLRIRLTAPAVENRANTALVDFLSTLLNVRKSNITIRSGLRSREKSIKMTGVSINEVERALKGAGLTD